MTRLAIYVPRAGTRGAAGILPGSGIVGREGGWPGDYTLVDFEGNRYGAVNMRTFADRVHHAAGRALASYPTVARIVLPDDQLHHVGWWDHEDREVVLPGGLFGREAARLRDWLGITDAELDAELRCTP